MHTSNLKRRHDVCLFLQLESIDSVVSACFHDSFKDKKSGLNVTFNHSIKTKRNIKGHK